MIKTIRDIESQCTGCGCCVNICSNHGAIRMQKNEEGFYYPTIDEDKCVNCGLCVKACPLVNLKTDKLEKLPDALLAYAKKAETLKKVTSGGVFTAVAEYLLSAENAAVVGASYDSGFHVIHRVVDNIENVQYLTRSKYIQSKAWEVYEEIKERLISGQTILFCGMACQIYGIKSYLATKRVSMEKLYTMDLVCHGVPSDNLIDSYLQMLTEHYNSEVEYIGMREKEYTHSWFNAKMAIRFANGHELSIKSEADYFLKAFLGNIAMRPSCYNCQFKTIGRISDLTLGDCWFSRSITGNTTIPFDVTLVIPQTEKGKRLLECCEYINTVTVGTIEAIQSNGSMIYKSPSKHPYRDNFYVEVEQNGLKKAVEEYFGGTTQEKKSAIRSIKDLIKSFPGVEEKRFYHEQETEFRRRLQTKIPQEAFNRSTLKNIER